MTLRIGQGYDVHALVPNRPLILGGVHIPHPKGLLGAAALNDIGAHFPDTAAEHKTADSRHLLRQAYALVQQAGWRVVNVDSTLIAQQPKLRPHIAAMRANIAADLRLPENCVNIKGKTNEKLGYLGREEAIEAQAIVLLAAQ